MKDIDIDIARCATCDEPNLKSLDLKPRYAPWAENAVGSRPIGRRCRSLSYTHRTCGRRGEDAKKIITLSLHISSSDPFREGEHEDSGQCADDEVSD